MDPTFIATTDDSFQWSSLSLITNSDHGIDIIEKSITIEEEENQTIIDDIDMEGEKVDEKTNESAVDTNEEIKITTNTNQNSRIPIRQTEEHGDVEQTVNKKEIETTTSSSTSNEKKPSVNKRKYVRTQPKKIHECDQCGKVLSKRSKLIYHMRRHTKSKEKMPHKCSECGFVLNHKSLLIIHMRKHTGEKPFNCVKCEKVYSSKSAVKKHEMKHDLEDGTLSLEEFNNKYEQLKRTCEECGKYFYNQSHLASHVKSHQGIKDFQCDNCERGFTSRQSLKEHVDTIHKGLRSFPCKQCGKSFGRRAGLKMHLLTHADKLPFNCGFCLQGFKKKNLLKKHIIKSHHLGGIGELKTSE